MSMNNFKILAANAASWMATIISVELLKDFLQVLALIASILVSIGSLWWIRKQAIDLTEKNKRGNP